MKGLSTGCICLLAGLLSGCGPTGIPEGLGLDGVPALRELHVVTLERRLAAQAACTPAQFERLKPTLATRGFDQWGTFNGIAGVPGRVIIPITAYPLAYSFQRKNGVEVRSDIFRPLVIYDAQKQTLYFIMASDFGG